MRSPLLDPRDVDSTSKLMDFPQPLPPRGRGSSGGRDRTVSYEEKFEPPFYSADRQGTLLSSVFSLVSTILGGGVLSLPYAFSKAGLVLGSVLLVVVAAASDYSAFILVTCSRRGNAHTYEDVAVFAFGPKGKFVTMGMVVALTYLALIAYTILILGLVVPSAANFAPALWELDADSFLLKLVVGVTLEVCILPFAFLESFSKLRGLSYLCVGSITLVAVAVIAHFVGCLLHGRDSNESLGDDKFDDDERQHLVHDMLWPADGAMGVVAAVPVFVCTFICHFNVLPVHAELDRPTRGRLHGMVHGTIGYACFLYFVVGIAGFTFCTCVGIETPDNILAAFTLGDGVANAGRIGISLTLLLALPLILSPCRDTLLRLRVLLATGDERGVSVDFLDGGRCAGASKNERVCCSSACRRASSVRCCGYPSCF